MFKKNLFFPILLLFLILTSCSGLVRKTAIRTSAELFKEAAESITAETDWNYFKESAPAGIKTLEGFLSLEPSNQSLLRTLARAHAGYAYGVSETLFFKEVLTGEDIPTSAMQTALLHYSRTMDYALDYLKQYHISWEKIVASQQQAKGLKGFLQESLKNPKEHGDIILSLAQGLGGLINLQKLRPDMLVHLPLMKDLFDFGCELIPEYDQGLCDLFSAMYEAGRPAIMGGNATKARELFLKGMEKYPENYLLRVSYVQFSCLLQMDEKCYQEQKEIILYAQKEFEEKKVWNPKGSAASAIFTNQKLNLFNAIAFKRFEIIKSVEKTFF
ncbi:MAG: hypothetical protein KBD63_05740 [Bacteriovoracaceae bacterium]|nr:hypothetical protein [Bacteriovoracaceae bacterium]